MAVEWVLYVGFGLLVSAVAFWLWRQGLVARKQAEMDAELAELGRGVDGIAHDLSNLFAVVMTSLQVAGDAPDSFDAEVLGDAEAAAGAATKLLAAMRRRAGQTVTGGGSAEGVVRLAAAMHRGRGVPLRLEVHGDLGYRGDDAQASRVVHNLLFNALREAEHIDGAVVRIDLEPGRLVMENPVRDPALLGEEIWRPGISHAGSSGQGLAIVRQAAEAVGWRVHHELDGAKVRFVVEPAAPSRQPASEQARA